VALDVFRRVRVGVRRRQVSEEVRDWHPEDLGSLREAGGADPVGAALVFLHLLKGETQLLREGFLVHPDQQTARADAGADMQIDRVGYSAAAPVLCCRS